MRLHFYMSSPCLSLRLFFTSFSLAVAGALRALTGKRRMDGNNERKPAATYGRINRLIPHPSIVINPDTLMTFSDFPFHSSVVGCGAQRHIGVGEFVPQRFIRVGHGAVAMGSDPERAPVRIGKQRIGSLWKGAEEMSAWGSKPPRNTRRAFWLF